MSTFIEVQRLVLLNQPKKVLDIGIGMGMNGAGVRQWLDLGYVKNFKTQLIGIEVFEGYKNPLWGLYDEVNICAVEDYSTKELFDMIIMTDVIEHFDKLSGIGVINRLKRFLNPKGVLLVSTPAVWFEQGAAYGNEYERHRSIWSRKDFTDLGFAIVPTVDMLNNIYGHQMLLAEFIK